MVADLMNVRSWEQTTFAGTEIVWPSRRYPRIASATWVRARLVNPIGKFRITVAWAVFPRRQLKGMHMRMAINQLARTMV